MIRKALYLGTLAALTAVGATTSGATTYTFNYDGMAYNSSSTPGANSAVQTYMQGILAGVTVTGAGELSNNQYTGDGHVVGPVSGSTVTPLTLGSTNGGVQHSLSTTSPDNYIVNNPSSNTTIEIIFPKAMYTVSFDYEIFPDGTCPNPTSGNSSVNLGCTSTSSANWPDFKFYADSSLVSDVLRLTTVGAIPSGTLTHSTASGTSATEKAPQYLSGTVTYDFTSIGGVTDLKFVDWPARIGIDNLVVNDCCKRPPQDLPEPGSLALVGAALAGLGLVVRRRRRTA